MIIQQFKLSPLAYAPDELCACINKYSDNKSVVDNKINNNADIIHFHNKFISTKKKQLIQYHSEPEKVMLNYKYKKLVIGQYHATLPEYEDCKVVKNIIDLDKDIYKSYKEINKGIKVGFSPSVTKRMNKFYDKGYEDTLLILKRLKNKYNKVFDYDIITDVSLTECLERKSKCNIIIDECVTNSYHRSGLEGLALGKLTICSLDTKVINIFKNITKQNYIPFEIINLSNLECYLENIIINEKIMYVLDKGFLNYRWFKEYWNPVDIINEFIDIYKDIR